MKTMKNTSASLLLLAFAGIILIGCGQNSNQSESETAGDDGVKMEQPTELGMSQDSLDTQVQQKGLEVAKEDKSALIEEASYALNLAQEALDALENYDKTTAISALESATGKLEILLARDPELALVPLDVTVKTHDLVTSLEGVRDIKKAARRAIKDDYFQVVRDELANLASEIEISTSMLPLKTFPAAMKTAASLIEKEDMDAAKLTLYEAMNTVIIERRRIPLPVIRAEVMIGQAKKEDAKDEDRMKEVIQLLNNAEYQLILAEELGYGKRDSEYAELNKAIKELKKSVESDGDSQGLFDSLKTKLAKFKDRITK